MCINTKFKKNHWNMKGFSLDWRKPPPLSNDLSNEPICCMWINLMDKAQIIEIFSHSIIILYVCKSMKQMNVFWGFFLFLHIYIKENCVSVSANYTPTDWYRFDPSISLLGIECFKSVYVHLKLKDYKCI